MMKEEDKGLAHAWLAASEDSFTGTGQKSSAFWMHVFEIWVMLVPEEKLNKMKWTSTAITSHWATINQDVAKFCGTDFQVTSMKKSGYTDAQYFQDALEVFKAEGKGKKAGKEFAFMGCWHILIDAPKWKGRCRFICNPSKIANKKKVDCGAEKKPVE